MKNDDLNPFFIVGVPRSGTTYLANLLNSKANIVIPPETRFFIEYLEQTKFPLRKTTLDYNLHRLINFERIRDLNLDFNALKLEVSNFETIGPRELFLSILKVYSGEKSSEIHLGEKSPGHLMYLNEIFNIFPKAKIVVIVRDGRDCVNSLLRVPWHRGNREQTSIMWNYRMNLINRALKKRPEQFITIKYENLVLDENAVLKNILTFLGLEITDNIIESKSTNKSLVPEWEKEWKSNVNQPGDKSRIFSWKKENSIIEIKHMSLLMKNELIKHGYNCKSIQSNRFVDRYYYYKVHLLNIPYLIKMHFQKNYKKFKGLILKMTKT